MSDIFISYTSSDSEWAKWIAQELEKLGHLPHVHEWEISGGGNIMAWMEERHQKADHILCVISKAYLAAPYSSWERQAAQWGAASKRPNFALPVFVEDCEASTLFAITKRCDLHGVSVEDARARLVNFMTPATKPMVPVPFPGRSKSAAAPRPAVEFPGKAYALSNIPITIPRYFLGREAELVAINAQLASDKGPVAITALYGLRGVGKTTLAAAYADKHRADYRATWWIRAQVESTMRADLVALGARLGWVAAEEKEEPALAAVLERLRDEGDGILLIYDNATDRGAVVDYFPHGGAAQIVVTSNAPNWHGVAGPVEIEVWPRETGADYLIEASGRKGERDAALALSDALEGLPLAHEQAAAYCDRLGVSLGEYRKRFAAAPAKLLDDTRDAARDYGLTVAKTFALAIDEAAKRHPAAAPLIEHAALLASEPIPLFLFSEELERFSKLFGVVLDGDGLDEAIAALRAFALIDRETIADERNPTITTECLRLHRLVRQVSAARRDGEGRAAALRALIEAIVAVYPDGLYENLAAWPRARRLDAIALALLAPESLLPNTSEGLAAQVLIKLAIFRQSALGDYAQAKPLFERALAIHERISGKESPQTATCLNNLALLLKLQGNLEAARPLYERALAIDEKVRGPEHPGTATDLNNLAGLLRDQGDFAAARQLFERALAIGEKTLGSEHPTVATRLNNLALLLTDMGDLAAARPLLERALAIDEKVLGPEHPGTATDLTNLASLLRAQGDLAAARPLFERVLAIDEKALGPEHPGTAIDLNNLGILLMEQGDLAAARPLLERALAIGENTLGSEHPAVAVRLTNLAVLLQRTGDLTAARRLFERGLAIGEKTLDPEHPALATRLNNFAVFLQEQDDLAAALPIFERALAIKEGALGSEHHSTKMVARNFARALDAFGRAADAKSLRTKYDV